MNNELELYRTELEMEEAEMPYNANVNGGFEGTEEV